jgi:hypothetical protein
MADNRLPPQPLPDLTDPEMRHEHRDVNVWAVGKVGIALILTTIASLVLMFGVFRYFEVRENAAQIPPASTTTPPSALPPEPNLMFNQSESVNLGDIRAAEDKEINSYGWVDQAKGVARIPVDRAMDLIAQRGLPARSNTTVPAREGQKK